MRGHRPYYSIRVEAIREECLEPAGPQVLADEKRGEQRNSEAALEHRPDHFAVIGAVARLDVDRHIVLGAVEMQAPRLLVGVADEGVVAEIRGLGGAFPRFEVARRGT